MWPRSLSPSNLGCRGVYRGLGMTIGWTVEQAPRMGRRALLVMALGIAFAAAAAAGPVAPAHASCVITAPANITQSNDPNQAGAGVVYPAPATSGATCGSITCSPASGSFFPVGVTMVTCQSGGEAGSRASFTVRVNDTQPPTMTPPTNKTVANAPGQASAVVATGLFQATD